tara:strand:- start:1965 stop:2780 length:816 start_codon:yes stop_codon:yes gene_type:complete
MQPNDDTTAFIVTSTSVTIYAKGGQITVPNDSEDYKRVCELVGQGRNAEAYAIATRYQTTGNALKAVFKDAEITFVHGELRLNGERMSEAQSARIGEFSTRGIPVDPFLMFVARLQRNPSVRARTSLLEWITANNMPVTEDGCFIAFKIVKEDYWDIYTGKTFYHKPGSVVSMERGDVDEDPDRTCSSGAHFCGEGYLPYYGTRNGNRIVILKIAPEDVVSFPTDYNLAKGRACGYKVIQELQRSSVKKYLSTIDRAFVNTDDAQEHANSL